MNNKKSLGIMLDGGIFDEFMKSQMRDYLRKSYYSQEDLLGRKPTREEFGKPLDMDRWRVTRLVETLEMTELF